MKNLIYILVAMATALVATTACDDTSTTIGSSLIEDKVEVVMDSSFVLTGHSVAHERVQSRTITQLIGRIEAKGYGRFSSDIVTQFMPGLVMDAESFTADDIDSVKLVMQMTNGAFTGDSIIPMGLKVYPLTKALPSPIYSDFDPKDYYDASTPWGSTVYSATALGASDSIMGLASRKIEVMLPRDFAVKMYNQYKESPATFQTPQSFAQWFPGLYITNSFGNGRVTRIDKSFITMYYHVHTKSQSTGNDTIINHSNTYLAVTPEIITNNNISFGISTDLTRMVADGEALIVAPTGYDIEVDFPAQAIIDYYRSNSGPIALINGLTMEIPVEEIANDYGIAPPEHILLVKTSQANEFFAKNLINDGVNAFHAVYNPLKQAYVFTDMRDYIMDMLKKDAVTAEDTRFTLTPITIVSETSSGYNQTSTVVTGIVPYITNPVMARLRIDRAKIRFVFSKQTMGL